MPHAAAAHDTSTASVALACRHSRLLAAAVTLSSTAEPGAAVQGTSRLTVWMDVPTSLTTREGHCGSPCAKDPAEVVMYAYRGRATFTWTWWDCPGQTPPREDVP